MITLRFRTLRSRLRTSWRIARSRVATLVMLALVGGAIAIAASWVAGEARISQIFGWLYALQQNPPIWLQVPELPREYLLAPTAILFLTAVMVMKISPQPRPWSRAIVVAILLALTIRYVLWRSLSTLNLVTPLNGIFSLALFFMEMLMLANSTIQLYLMLRVKEGGRLSDKLALAVTEGHFTPSVDILIPTYNEPVFILKRTIMGCQALEYPNKKIYLLDDTQRFEMQQLARELGCEYIKRTDNRYAKAGNLNHAIEKTTSELIVVFDADFIPTQNFLNRTVGFFQDEKVALVQTPQSFYNPDPIARNLGLENILTPEEEVFYRQIQPIRDSAEGVICAGTSFVVRRSALEKAGGFVTNSLSEDYFTGIRLSAKGYRVIYLEEKLSAGLAAENMAAHIAQRLRWAQGTLQAFFIDSNPLTIPGLRPIQRLAHLEGLLSWFTSLSRVGFLMMPLAYSFLGVIPLQSTVAEAVYFLLPSYLVSVTVFSWLNLRSRSALLSDIYVVAVCFPLALTVIKVILNPFSKGFKVTPKGTASDRVAFNWTLAWPLLVVWIGTAISLWCNLGFCLRDRGHAPLVDGLNLGWIWSAYNLITISIALLILVDVPKPDVYDWLDVRRVVKLTAAGKSWWGITTAISEVGVQVTLTQQPPMAISGQLPVTLEIMEEGLELQGQIIYNSIPDEFSTLRVMFDQLTLSQHRRLVELVFCRPGQWMRRETPGEWSSLVILFRVLLKPRFLFDRKGQVKAIAVSPG